VQSVFHTSRLGQQRLGGRVVFDRLAKALSRSPGASLPSICKWMRADGLVSAKRKESSATRADKE
jgi:hypothetical protein